MGWAGLCALLALASAPPGAAEPPSAAEPPTTPAPNANAYEPIAFVRSPPLLPRGVSAGAARRLSLHDAIALAVQGNLGIALRKEQLAISAYGVEESRGGFEPLLRASLRRSDIDTPPRTLQEGQPGQVQNIVTDSWSLGYSQRLRFGTGVGLDFENGRSESSLASAVEPLIYSSRLQLRLTQPLLAGFGFDLDIPYADVLRAELESEQARKAVSEALIVTVRNTEQAYWSLFQALKSYEVQLASIELAAEQVELTQRQIEAGVRPPFDRINAEGTVAERELALVQAEAAIGAAADRLRYLLNLPRERWTEPLLPIDVPSYAALDVGFDVALREALARRPELAMLELEQKRAALELRVADNQRLPRLDAEVTYGWVGQDPGYADTLEQLVTRAAPGWSAMLNFSWTPQNRAADARRDAVAGAARVARLTLEQRLLDVQLELKEALRALATAERSLHAAARVRKLAEQSLDAEERRYASGDGGSSSFFVAQRQEALARAQLDELAALIQHQQAKTALQAAMGVLLDERRVKLDVRAQ